MKFLLAISFLAAFALNFISYYFGEMRLQEYVVFFSLCVSFLIISLDRKKYSSLGMLFFCVSVIFLLGRYVSSFLFSRNNYTIADWFIYGKIDQNTLSSALLACTVFLMTYSVSYSADVIFGKRSDVDRLSRSTKKIMTSNRLAPKTFFLLASIIFLPFAVLRAFGDLEDWQAASYISNYLIGGGNGWIDKLGSWFIYAIFGYIAFSESSKKAFIGVIIGLLISLCEALAGARGIPIAQGVSITWLYCSKYNVRINIFKMAGMIFPTILLIDYIGVARVGLPYELYDRVRSLPVVFMDVIFSQGTTFILIVATIENISRFDFIDAITSVFSNFLDYTRLIFGQVPVGNSISLAESSFSLAHKISFRTSPEMYLSGFGLGGSIVAESMLFSKFFGPLVFGLLVGFFLKFYINLARFHTTVLYVLAATFPYILLLSRENSLYFVIPLIKAVALVFLYRIICWVTGFINGP